jgi:hypothetical protein
MLIIESVVSGDVWRCWEISLVSRENTRFPDKSPFQEIGKAARKQHIEKASSQTIKLEVCTPFLGYGRTGCYMLPIMASRRTFLHRLRVLGTGPST